VSDTPTVAPKSAAPKTTGKKAPPKSARRRSRELALQGLYQWLLSGESVSNIEVHIAEMDGFGKCDRAHFDALLHGGIEQAAALDAVLAQHVDRKTTQLSPVEHAALMIGCYELMHCLEVPYRVAINEAVELTKSFGGTDGHKYVNGVLDRCATQLRPAEAGASRTGPR
jgi:transcription antitermination protein NusB